MNALFDPGLQPERTQLAWRRTALAIAVGSLVALRLLPAALGDPLWAAIGVTGMVAAGALWLAAARRSRVVTETLLRDGDRARLPGAGLHLALATFVLVLGAGGVGLAIASAFHGSL